MVDMQPHHGEEGFREEFTGLKKVDLCVDQQQKEQDRRSGGECHHSGDRQTRTS